MVVIVCPLQTWQIWCHSMTLPATKIPVLSLKTKKDYPNPSGICHVGVEGCRVHHKHLPLHWLTPFSQLSGGCRIFRASLGLRGTCTRINLPHKPEAPFRQENLGNAAILPVNQHLAPWSSFAPSYASVHQSCASESWILKQSCEVKRKELSWTLRKASASTNMHSCRSQIAAVLLPRVPSNKGQGKYD